MTAKEKAEELFFKMTSADVMYMTNYSSKQCALIAVDEIINCDSFFSKLADLKEFTEYWYEVKQEIQKL